MTSSTEAANLARGGKISTTIGYYVAFVGLGLVGATLGPTLPYLAERTHSQLSDISLLFSAYSMGYLVGSFQGGRWYDRRPGHRVMASMLVVMAALMALVPLLSSLWILVVAWFVLGAACGALDVGGNTLLVWVHRQRVGPFMSGLHFFWGVGAFLSPVLTAWAMLAGGDARWSYWTLALLILPGLVWLLRLPSPTAQSSAEEGQVRQADRPLLVMLVLFFLLGSGAEFAFGGWIFSYAVALDLADATAAAYLTSAYWGALTLTRLLAIPIAARVRPRFILWGSLVAGLLSLGIILWGSDWLWAVRLGSLGMGMAMASLFPSMLSLVGRHIRISGRVTGWFFVGASLGSMSLPWLVGQLFEPIGPRVTMVLITIDLVVALGVLATLLAYLARPAARAQA